MMRTVWTPCFGSDGISCRANRAALLVLPRREEQPLQLGDSGAADFDRRVTPIRMIGIAIGGNAIAWLIFIDPREIDAADESDAAIDHHDLPVIAIVRRAARECGQWIDRIERNSKIHDHGKHPGHDLHFRRRRGWPAFAPRPAAAPSDQRNTAQPLASSYTSQGKH
jgi:hypothetical protein